MANLMNLNDDSMRLIFDQLDVDCPQSFKQLALVSKGAKRLADSFRWRSITLSDDGPLSATSEQLIMLLLDTNHDLSKHVRQITVSDFKGDKDWFKLEQVLCNLKYLQSFAWNANRHIPEDFISTLENWWPDANLFVNNLRRPEAERESIPLDWRLLGSPSLYSLTCLVFLYDTVGDLVVDSGATNYILRPRSELEAVRRVLVGKSRLRILKLEIASTESWNHLPDQVFAIRSVQYWQQDNLNLPLQAEDRLPPLREFNLPGKAQTKLGFYDFTPEHCKALEYSMDWSRLRCLDLGNRCPPHFFKRFCGRLPNLRSLYIGLRKAPYNGCIDGYDDPAIVIDFINSIDRLESLSIINESMDWNVLLPAISKQAKSLQSLTARAPVDLSRYHSPEWRNSDLEKLAGVWKGLEQLEIDMNDEVFEQVSAHSRIEAAVYPN
ncbi:uncharacterized protein BDZ99DRAFT_520861 [Mytilinidion resinicola]|uniref:Uncharacterized protein n=1 Tax=Mytilinidion resinicola TaxID=574789 RepID=A0A6A6YL30_9PEZI|nr:uncharacterized protein BDZ99DRAFT_520861 [Mytilinidion resinicola]KAF2809510.1 hypothetical protein BDZ99DRAFT_520861 [Mytilinidion resinicola]